MAKRWNIVKPIDIGNGKTHWHKLGVMFETKSGNGFNILLDSMPAPEDGNFKMLAFEHDESKFEDKKENKYQHGPLDDEIKF